MDSFEFNKIMGAVLGTLLFVMGVGFLAEAIYHPIVGNGPGYALPEPEPTAVAEAGPAEPRPAFLDHFVGRLVERLGGVVDAALAARVGEGVGDAGGRGADASIEALGTQGTFESALRVLKPGGTLSSLGVYSSDLTIPMAAFAAGLGDYRINTALCPGGKERMRRLMNVVASSRLDLGVLVTHTYPLDDIVAAYDLFAHQRDGVLKIAIKPG